MVWKIVQLLGLARHQITTEEFTHLMSVVGMYMYVCMDHMVEGKHSNIQISTI